MNTVTNERTSRFVAVDERESLILSARKLVFKIARDYRDWRDSGLAFDDLVQEGNEGLCLAADKFDPTRGIKFTTYAAFWIRAKMLSFVVSTHGPVRFGTTRSQRRIYFNLGKARRRLEKLGEEVTLERLAGELRVSVEDLTRALPRVQNTDWSLDTEVEGGLKFQLRDGRPDAESTLDVVRRTVVQGKRLREAVESLGGRMAEVVKLRFLREEPLTLRAIGDKWGVSRERARQVEAQALRLLKKRMEKLEEEKDVAFG